VDPYSSASFASPTVKATYLISPLKTGDLSLGRSHVAKLVDFGCLGTPEIDAVVETDAEHV
jgi:hypothetical protein